jgi:hypothetical protein
MQRFWDKVNILGENDCWEWQAAFDTNGYGAFKVDGKKVNSHRFAYILTNGEVQPGLEICHKCNNPKCVNPAHLYAGTKSQNMLDMVRAGNYKLNTYEKMRGEKSGASKLTNDAVLEIRRLYSKNVMTLDKLAKRYNMSKSAIASIIWRKSWTHI